MIAQSVGDMVVSGNLVTQNTKTFNRNGSQTVGELRTRWSVYSNNGAVYLEYETTYHPDIQTTEEMFVRRETKNVPDDHQGRFVVVQAHAESLQRFWFE